MPTYPSPPSMYAMSSKDGCWQSFSGFWLTVACQNYGGSLRKEGSVFYHHTEAPILQRVSTQFPLKFLRRVFQEATWAQRVQLLAQSCQRKCNEFFETCPHPFLFLFLFSRLTAWVSKKPGLFTRGTTTALYHKKQPVLFWIACQFLVCRSSDSNLQWTVEPAGAVEKPFHSFVGGISTIFFENLIKELIHPIPQANTCLFLSWDVHQVFVIPQSVHTDSDRKGPCSSIFDVLSFPLYLYSSLYLSSLLLSF